MNPTFTKEPLCFDDPAQNVWKYVFHFKDAIAEAVLYRYNSFEDRTVLCVSVQSGCPVGCVFCGTGRRFVRNLEWGEIVAQVDHIIEDKQIEADNCKKFQIMFMSMGEPFLNYEAVKEAIIYFTRHYPLAQLLISTIGPRKETELVEFIQLSQYYPQIGLQFSIHKPSNHLRDKLIPYKDKLSLEELRNYGVQWWHETGRKVYLNYCIDGSNATQDDLIELQKLFPPNVFCFTFSVICSKDETMKAAGYHNLEIIRTFESWFKDDGYDTRIFDPAGADTIGGGCGQLFYVQEWLRENK